MKTWGVWEPPRATDVKIRIVKDDFFATKKWFIETDGGFKWNTVGFTTKKAALAAVEVVGLTVEN
jgi:hypothetical protein